MRRLNRNSFVTLLILPLCLHFAAGKLNAQEAYKVDVVINPRCDFSEVPQITDPPPTGRIFAALDENKDAKAAIIVYGMPGKARRYAKRVRWWLYDVRGVDPKRLIALYGGLSNELRLELWLIPQEASLPKVNPADDYQSATLFETFTYWKGEYNSCGAGRAEALHAFAEALKQRSGWQGYIVIRLDKISRGIKVREVSGDPDGYVSRQQALRRVAKDKSYLVKKFGLAPTQIKALVGDNDEWTHAELWLVPPGAEPPGAKAKSSIKER